METHTTYRLVVLNEDRQGTMYKHGESAATPELAKLIPGTLSRGANRLGIERTDWLIRDNQHKPLTRLVDAEKQPGEWTIGA